MSGRKKYIKKLTDLSLWDTRWFLEASMEMKMAYLFITADSDLAGIHEMNVLRVREKVGFEGFNYDDFLETFNWEYDPATGQKRDRERFFRGEGFIFLTTHLKFARCDSEGFMNPKEVYARHAISSLRRHGIYDFAIKKELFKVKGMKKEEKADEPRTEAVRDPHETRTAPVREPDSACTTTNTNTNTNTLSKDRSINLKVESIVGKENNKSFRENLEKEEFDPWGTEREIREILTEIEESTGARFSLTSKTMKLMGRALKDHDREEIVGTFFWASREMKKDRKRDRQFEPNWFSPSTILDPDKFPKWLKLARLSKEKIERGGKGDLTNDERIKKMTETIEAAT